MPLLSPQKFSQSKKKKKEREINGEMECALEQKEVRVEDRTGNLPQVGIK